LCKIQNSGTGYLQQLKKNILCKIQHSGTGSLQQIIKEFFLNNLNQKGQGSVIFEYQDLDPNLVACVCMYGVGASWLMFFIFRYHQCSSSAGGLWPRHYRSGQPIISQA
jgi:hypothetical protein